MAATMFAWSFISFLSLWVDLSSATSPTVFDQYTFVKNTPIGWIKAFECTHAIAPDSPTFTFYRNLTKKDLPNYYLNAISIQILPNNSTPSDYDFDNATNEYAVMADICSNTILKLNNNTALSWPFGIATEEYVNANWLGSDTALPRFVQDPSRCQNKSTADKANGYMYNACGNPDGVRLSTTHMCQLQFGDDLPNLDGLAVWIGYDKFESCQCDNIEHSCNLGTSTY